MDRSVYIITFLFITAIFALATIDPNNPLLWALESGRHVSPAWLLLAGLFLGLGFIGYLRNRFARIALATVGFAILITSLLGLVDITVPLSSVNTMAPINYILGAASGSILASAGLQRPLEESVLQKVRSTPYLLRSFKNRLVRA